MSFLVDKLTSRAEESARLYPDVAGTPEDTYNGECTIYDLRPSMVSPSEEPTPPYLQASAAMHGKRQTGVSIAGLWVVPKAAEGRAAVSRACSSTWMHVSPRGQASTSRARMGARWTPAPGVVRQRILLCGRYARSHGRCQAL